MGVGLFFSQWHGWRGGLGLVRWMRGLEVREPWREEGRGRDGVMWRGERLGQGLITLLSLTPHTVLPFLSLPLPSLPDAPSARPSTTSGRRDVTQRNPPPPSFSFRFRKWAVGATADSGGGRRGREEGMGERKRAREGRSEKRPTGSEEGKAAAAFYICTRGKVINFFAKANEEKEGVSQ